MYYIVELAIDTGNLALEFSQMRTWLDHMKYRATGFRRVASTNLYRIHFEDEQEARAFAQAFAGQLRNRAAPERAVGRPREVQCAQTSSAAGEYSVTGPRTARSGFLR
jgi:hypothetical protein